MYLQYFDFTLKAHNVHKTIELPKQIHLEMKNEKYTKNSTILLKIQKESVMLSYKNSSKYPKTVNVYILR